MRSAIAIGLLVLLGSSCCSESLGHGYHLVRRSETSVGFEGRVHYRDLYLRKQRLGTVGQYSISPSGRYVLFEDVGRLRLFDRKAGQAREMTEVTSTTPRSFGWNETMGVVVVYYEDHQESRIELPR